MVLEVLLDGPNQKASQALFAVSAFLSLKNFVDRRGCRKQTNSVIILLHRCYDGLPGGLDGRASPAKWGHLNRLRPRP